MLQRALTIKENALGPMHPNIAKELFKLGRVLKAMGRFTEARQNLLRADAIAQNVFSPTDQWRLGIWEELRSLGS